MNVKQLERLLNNACEIIISLEHYADESLNKDIDALFNELKYADDIDDELALTYTQWSHTNADDEAQDFDIFGNNKI
jgi:hypothetical protein